VSISHTSIRTPAPRPDSETLTAQQLKFLRDCLQEYRQERLEQQAALATQPVTGDAVAIAHRQSVRRLLADIESALFRMDAGTYGTCVHCGQALPYERLELLPYATACVRCLNSISEGW
jgi:DnaK suppressor protein